MLRFIEALDVSLSSVSVVGPDGVDARGEGPTLSVVGNDHAMQRRLGLLRPGIYSVPWRSVSALDGHALAGSYQFGIGTFALPTVSVHDDPVSSEGWAGLVGRLLMLGGLAVWFGATVLSRWRRRDERSAGRLARVRHVGPLAVLTGTDLLVVSSALRATGSLSALPSVVTGSKSGWLRLTILAVAGCGVALRGRAACLDDILATTAIVAEAAAEHAAAAPHPLLATAVFALHLGAVGAWVTAIVVAALSGRDVVRVLRSVAPAVVAATGIVAVSGVTVAAFEIDRVAALADTAYGRAVLVKAAVLVAMVIAGLVHRQGRGRPDALPGRVRRPVVAEVTLAVGALVVATLLTGFANPPREEAAAEELVHSEAPLVRLTSRPALSLAAADGRFVVGFTLAPPEPGAVSVLVTIVGAEPGDGLREVRLIAGTDSDPTTNGLARCVRLRLLRRADPARNRPLAHGGGGHVQPWPAAPRHRRDATDFRRDEPAGPGTAGHESLEVGARRRDNTR